MKLASTAAWFVALTAVTAWPAIAQNPATDSGDYRTARWGQSVLEVQELERSAPFYRDDSLVIYRDEFQDVPADIIYFFVDDRLVMGFTHLLIRHDNLKDYFDDYESLKSSLGIRLGSPDAENWDMSLPELEQDRSLWGDALGFGLMKVESGWLLGQTGIALRLSGGNFRGHLMMAHFSRNDMNAGRVAYKEYFGDKVGIPNEYFR